jgi:hypothetical protein
MRRRHGTTKTTHHRRTDLAFAGVAALVLVGFAFLVVLMEGLGHDLRAANEARDSLAAQVERLGASPVAGPPGSRGEPGNGVEGPRGERGPTGSLALRDPPARRAHWAPAVRPARTARTAARDRAAPPDLPEKEPQDP